MFIVNFNKILFTMTITNNFPREIILSCFESANNVGALFVLNKRCRTIVKELYFPKFNQEITKDFPFLEKKLNSSRKEKCSETKIFIRLVNHLHDKAKCLGCEIQPSKKLTPMRRMIWECNHTEALSSRILNHVQFLKFFEKDKNTLFFQEILELFPLKLKKSTFYSKDKQNQNRRAIHRIKTIEQIHKKSDEIHDNIKKMNSTKFKLYIDELTWSFVDTKEIDILLQAPQSLYLAYKIAMQKGRLKSFKNICTKNTNDTHIQAFIIDLLEYIKASNNY